MYDRWTDLVEKVKQNVEALRTDEYEYSVELSVEGKMPRYSRWTNEKDARFRFEREKESGMLRPSGLMWTRKLVKRRKAGGVEYV